jgi:hypothetical protein
LDLTVQGGQSPASYMDSAADWPPLITRVPRKPKVAQFCAAPWPNFTPPLTPPPGRDAASLRADSPNFGRLRDHRRRSGRKTLDQVAQSGDLDVRMQATWGMSDGMKCIPE